MFVTFRCLLSTTVSTCFGHHYAHHQENKDCISLHMVFALVVLDVAGCSCDALFCRVRAPYDAMPHNCNQPHQALMAQTPYAVIHDLCSPDDGHNDARNMLRQ